MEDKLKKIYALYIQKGLLTAEGTTFEKWSQADEAQQIKLFELGQRKGLFGKETPAESFTSLWSLKKKDESQPIGQEGVMESDTQVVQEEPISSEFSGVEAEFETPEFVTEEEVIGQVPDEFGGGDVVQYEAGRRRRGQAGVISKGEKNTWLERTVGKNEVTDFFGDLWRAGAKGYETGNTIDEALELSFKGRSASDQDIADFIRVNNSLNQTGPSDEMQAFNKAYSAAGGGAWGFIKGIIAAPTSVNEIAVTSVAQMVNPAVAAGAGAGAGAGAAIGSTGFSAGPLGVFTTAGGAIAGALGGAGATLEAGLSFSEFLQEELAEKGLAFDQEGIRKVLEDEEAMFRIRTRSAGRGAAIGIIDGFTAGFASKIAKGVGQTAIKAGKTAKRANLAATAAATGIEGLGGGVGEAAARALVGQEMDAAEIGFEIVGGAPGSAITMLRNTAGRGKYTMGPDEAPVTFEQMVKIIEETDDATFAGMKLRIKGDEVLKGMAEDRKDALKQKQAKVEQLGEDLDNLSVEDAEAAIELETELDKVSGGLTRAKKNRKKEIETQLDEIYSRRQEPAVEAVVEVTEEEVFNEIGRRAEEDGRSGDITTSEEIESVRQELLKQKQDAIQESSTTDVDVQEQTEDGQPMGDGDSEGGVTVEGEGETEGATEATQEEIEQGAQDLGDLISGLTDSPANLGDATSGRNVTEDTEETSVEVVSGIDAEGNPVMAPSQPGVEVNENLTVVDQTETDSHYGSEVFRRENPNVTPQQHETMLMERVDKALKSVKKLFPKVKIVMHRSEASYKNIIGTGSRGAFDPNTNTIHINMPRATGRTIGHEVFHAILKDRFGSEVNIQTATKALIKSLRAGINKSTNLTAEQVLELERYAQIFDGDKAIVQDEEFLAEFVGFLSETYSKLEVPQQTAIKQWLAKIAQIFGFSPEEVLAQSDRDVVDLLNTIAGKVTEGQEITEADVAMLGTEERAQADLEAKFTERQVLETPKPSGKKRGTAREAESNEVVLAKKGNLTLIKNNKTKEDIIQTEGGAKLIRGIDTNGETYFEVEGDLNQLKTLGFNPNNFAFDEGKIQSVIDGLIDSKIADKKPSPPSEQQIRERSKRKQAEIKQGSPKQRRLKSRQEDKAGIKAFEDAALTVVGEEKNKTIPDKKKKKTHIFTHKGKEYSVYSLGPENVNEGNTDQRKLGGAEQRFHLVDLSNMKSVEASSEITNYFIHSILEEQGNIGAEAYAIDRMLSPAEVKNTTLVKGGGASQIQSGKKVDNPADALKTQVIGQNAELSAQVREDLQYAKIEHEAYMMQKEGVLAAPTENMMNPAAIKEITGWELGADGKWKYEIQDGRLKEEGTGVWQLSDIYDAPEFYDAYPEAKDILVSIEVRPEGKENSWYMPGNEFMLPSIEINVKNQYRVVQDLVHELQHFVQYQEGFAIGGNESTFAYNPELVKQAEKEGSKEGLVIKNEMLRALSFTIEEAIGEHEGVALDKIMTKEFLEKNMGFYLDTFDNLVERGLIDEDADFAQALEDFYVELPEMDRRKLKIAQREGGMNEALDVALEIAEPVRESLQKLGNFAMYERLMGEVEARNVTKRLFYTAEQRARKTLESTEDVAREEQIAFFDSDSIKTQAVTEVEGGQKVSKPSSALKTQAIGAFEVSYTQQEKVAQMIKEGLITEPDDISFLKGKDTIITSPDDMLVGEISLNGKPIFEGGGGVFFVTKHGEVWAAGKKATAEQIARGINRGVKDNGGKGYLTLTKGADKKLVSSASGVNSTLAILDSMLDEGLVSPSNFRAAVSSAVKKAGGEIDLRGSSKKLKADVNEYFSDPSTTTFEKRGSVVEAIVGEIAKSLPKELRPKVVQFLGGDPNKSVGVGNTPKSQSLVDLVAGVAAEKLTKGLSVGDVYAVIEVDGEVEVVKGDHKSYPWHVKLKDGSKPILHLPKNREAGGKALVQKSGKPYAVRNVSVVEGKFQGQTEAIKTQAIPPIKQTKREFVARIEAALKGEGSFAHMTAENPANETMSAKENAVRNKELEAELEARGYDAVKIGGKYGRPEKSFFVPDISEADAIEIGKKYGQESVAHSKGMLYTTGKDKGKRNPITGDVEVNNKLEDYYSEIQTKGGKVKYSVGYNFDVLTDDAPIKTQVFNPTNTTEDIIKFGRENNFSDAMIKDYLVRIKKEKVKEVNRMMAIDVDMFRQMPVSFGNIEGGAKVGAKLFARVENFMEKLNAKNNKRKEENRISEREVMDQTIEFLEKQPAYIAEGGKRKAETDQQTQMIIDMQKALGVNPTKGMNTRIREMRQKMVERRRGGMDLQAVKRDLRNFIRQALPTIKGSTYSKSELMTLLGKVAKADKKNIANLMDEVVDIVTKRQVKALDAKIESILNGKYEVVQSGRLKGVKIDNETRERLERIKDAVTDEAMTAEDIVAANLTLNEEFTKLNEKPDQTEQDLNRMADLMVIMSLNNSKLMDDTSIDKVESLNTAEDILLQIVGEGKETFKEQLRADHERYQDQFVKVYKDVTGETIDLSNPEIKDESKKAARKQARAQKARDAEKGLVKYLRKFNRKIKSFLKSSESIEGLMHIIAEAPGAIFGGNARKLVYEKLSAAERVYKARMMEASTFIQSKVKEVYGKDWKEISRGNSVRTQTGVYVDPAAVKKAQEKYDANKTFGNKKALEDVKREEMVSLSPNEIGYLWQQYQDPANLPSFANEENVNFGADHARIMSELVESIGGEDGKIIELAKWQVEEAYPSMYDHINEAYKKIYRTNMPWNKFYAGMLKREGRETQPLDMLASKEAFNNQVGGASTKMRIKNSRPIEPRDMMGALVTYTTDMEWFAAMGPTVRDINKLFGNPMMRKAIINVTGESTMRLIDHHIKNIAARGVNTERGQDFVNAMNNMFATTRLGFSPNIAIKQLTSIPTYATDIGWGNYVFHAVKNKAEFIKVLNEIRENSVYMQDRLSSDIRKVTESYSANQDVEFVPKSASSYFVNMMMGFIKAGDITAIYLGGMPNYSFYKSEFMKANPNATEQEAIDHAIVKFELDTKSTQQSMDLTDKDFYQSSGAFARALNLFKTSQKQYLRKEFAGMRNLRRGFRDKNFKQILDGGNKVLMYHFMMPMLFQYIASGLPGLMTGWEDEDKEDMIRAAVLGNFNALFAVGDIIKGTADAVQGKPWADKVGSIPIFEVFADINKNYMKWQETKDLEKKQEAFEKMMARIGEVVTLGKIPFANINRMYKNIEKAGDAKTGEEVTLRLLNYSDYVIEGPKKSKAKEEGEKKFTPAPSRDARGKKSRSRDRR